MEYREFTQVTQAHAALKQQRLEDTFKKREKFPLWLQQGQKDYTERVIEFIAVRENAGFRRLLQLFGATERPNLLNTAFQTLSYWNFTTKNQK